MAPGIRFRSCYYRSGSKTSVFIFIQVHKNKLKYFDHLYLTYFKGDFQRRIRALHPVQLHVGLLNVKRQVTVQKPFAAESEVTVQTSQRLLFVVVV